MMTAPSSFEEHSDGGCGDWMNEDYDAMGAFVPSQDSRLQHYDDVFAYRVAMGFDVDNLGTRVPRSTPSGSSARR